MIEYLPLVLTGIGIIVSILYYTSVLRNQNKTRQAQLFMQLYTRFNEKEHHKIWTETIWGMEWTDFQDWYSKYGPITNPDGWSSMQSIHTFFEGLGVLVQRGLIDITMVDDLMSSNIIITWEKFRPLIYQIRKEWGVPQMWEWVEYLYGEIRKIAIKQHPELKDKDMLAKIIE